MSEEKIIDRPGSDRRNRLCQCEVCGGVDRCLPGFDFYERKDKQGLTCEDCFRGVLANQGVRL